MVVPRQSSPTCVINLQGVCTENKTGEQPPGHGAAQLLHPVLQAGKHRAPLPGGSGCWRKGHPTNTRVRAGVESGTPLSEKSTAVNETLCKTTCSAQGKFWWSRALQATASAPCPQQPWKEQGSPSLNSTFIFYSNSSPTSTAPFPNQRHV